jgi:hypothetical protein
MMSRQIEIYNEYMVLKHTHNPTALSHIFCCQPSKIGNISVSPNSGQ